MAAPDYNAIYKQSLEQAKAAAQPAIASLESQRPLLQNQYSQSVNNINTQQSADIGDTNTTLSREYGARGIPLSSGVFGQNLNQATGKIRQYYTGQLGNAANQRDSALANLNQQLASLQSGYQQNAIQAAQNLYGQRLSSYDNELNRQAQLRAASIAAAPSINLGQQNKVDPIAAQHALADDLQQWLKGTALKGANFLTFVQRYAPYLPIKVITDIYMQNAKGFGKPRESQDAIITAYNKGKGGF